MTLWLQTPEGNSDIPVFSGDGETKMIEFPTQHRFKCL